MRLRKRHLTVLDKGDPVGIPMLSELLRAEGLRVNGSLRRIRWCHR
jgi:hypothetical protein